MFGSLLILLILPLTDLSIIRGNQFRPAMKLAFWFFVVDFIILMWIGSQHPTTPFVEIGQVATAFYFSWFIIIVPIIGLLENTLFSIALDSKKTPIGYNPFRNLINIFKNIIPGVKSGLSIPVVPKCISDFDNNIYVKIFKLLGSLSTLIIISQKGILLNAYIYNMIFIFSILFIFYKIIFALFAFKQWIYYFSSDKYFSKVNVFYFIQFLVSTNKFLITIYICKVFISVLFRVIEAIPI
jgi:Cytochrome b(C-terminal)/b6/petD